MNDFESDNTCSAGDNHQLRVRKWAGQLAQSAAHTMQELTARKYTLPDKNVASQLLMYRQLLHTKCRPGLKLSRDYQGTPAQQAVKHMPWWAQGCETTGKMVISYDNLIRRLWLHGAIFPYTEDCSNESSIDTLLNAEGMPPIPHDYWVHRLGFQQQDPVTDFRSGGVLSLALMLHVAESCPHVFSRYVRPTGDASVLPFGITSINVTDMLSKFLMLAKTVDRMDALLSQKPFWRMFADPNAITACQELSMDMLADVVVEMATKRGRPVTVFDFSAILAQTERRVQYDLLGAGPKSVAELYQVHARVKLKYQQKLESNMISMSAEEINNNNNIMMANSPQQQQEQKLETQSPLPPTTTTTSPSSSPQNNSDHDNHNNNNELKEHVLQTASVLASSASNLAGSVFSRIKLPTTGFHSSFRKQEEGEEGNHGGSSSGGDRALTLPNKNEEPIITIDFSPAPAPASSAPIDENHNPAPTAVAPSLEEEEWVQAGVNEEEEEIQQAVTTTTMAVMSSNFAIEDDDDDKLL